MNNYQKGRYFEEIVVTKLKSQKYNVIARNFLIPRICEIDVIATHGQIIYFIEVRGRTNNYLGGPNESIDISKILKIKKAISYFFKNNTDYRNYYPQILFCFVVNSKLTFVKYS